jgi:hypothetical protein
MINLGWVRVFVGKGFLELLICCGWRERKEGKGELLINLVTLVYLSFK